MAAQQPSSIIVVTSVEMAFLTSESTEQHPHIHVAEDVVMNMNPLQYPIQEVGFAAIGGNNPAGNAYQGHDRRRQLHGGCWPVDWR